MFYNARWVDVSLGRFAQADTLVGGDRYAYVNNSPARFTDPSGHRSCDDVDENGKCITYPGNFSKSSPTIPGLTPDSIDQNQLSPEISSVTGISGAGFFKWYEYLYNQPKSSWWWQMFGSDGFSVWDAMAVVMVSEAQFNWIDPNLPEAAIRAANKHCGSPCTTEDYINWFAGYSATGGNLVTLMTTQHDPRGGWIATFDLVAQQALNRFSKSFYSHSSNWNVGCVDNRPCGWANNTKEMYPTNVRQKLQSNQAALFTYNPKDGLKYNPWFIPSGCVSTYWLDKNQRNLDQVCDSVR